MNSGGPGHDPSHITNPWLSYNRENSPTMINELQNGETVKMSVLAQDTDICKNVNNTVINGVKVQVMEERETRTSNGELFEVSCNYFAQAPDGTVCYYGEYVDNGHGTPIGGGWIAGDNANAGIMMPAHPAVGQRFMIEDASNAREDGYIQSIGNSQNTPFKNFTNTMYVVEDHGASNKTCAQCYGMIKDEGMLMTNSNLTGCSN